MAQERFSFQEAIAGQTLRYRQRMTIKVATGESYKLALFIEIAFGLVGLDWWVYVAIDRQ